MNKFEKVKKLLQRYKHIWVFTYGLIYLPWFYYLEKTVTSRYHIIHSPIDDMIPFIEYFIVPYLLWFVFMAAVVLFFFFKDIDGFYRLCAHLFTGMTIFLIISTIWPNGLSLRPMVFERDNIFVDMVKMLYRADTPTNVLPSIHVYNTLGLVIAISQSEEFQKHKVATWASYILSALIILATMFLKQHSIIDVVAASGMAYIMYVVVYVLETKKVPKVSRQPILFK